MKQRSRQPASPRRLLKQQKNGLHIHASHVSHSLPSVATRQQTSVRMDSRFTPTRQTVGWTRPKIASIAEVSKGVDDYVHLRLAAPFTKISSASAPYSVQLGCECPETASIISDSDAGYVSSSSSSMYEDYESEQMQEVDDASSRKLSRYTSPEKIEEQWTREVENKDRLLQEGNTVSKNTYPTSALLARDAHEPSCTSSGASLFQEKKETNMHDMQSEDTWVKANNIVLREKRLAFTSSVHFDVSRSASSQTTLHDKIVGKWKREEEKENKLSQKGKIVCEEINASAVSSVSENDSRRTSPERILYEEIAGKWQREGKKEKKGTKEAKAFPKKQNAASALSVSEDDSPRPSPERALYGEIVSKWKRKAYLKRKQSQKGKTYIKMQDATSTVSVRKDDSPRTSPERTLYEEIVSTRKLNADAKKTQSQKAKDYLKKKDACSALLVREDDSHRSLPELLLNKEIVSKWKQRADVKTKQSQKEKAYLKKQNDAPAMLQSDGDPPRTSLKRTLCADLTGTWKRKADLTHKQSHKGKPYVEKRNACTALSISKDDSPRTSLEHTLCAESVDTRTRKARVKHKQSQKGKTYVEKQNASSALSPSDDDSGRNSPERTLYEEIVTKWQRNADLKTKQSQEGKADLKHRDASFALSVSKDDSLRRSPECFSNKDIVSTWKQKAELKHTQSKPRQARIKTHDASTALSVSEDNSPRTSPKRALREEIVGASKREVELKDKQSEKGKSYTKKHKAACALSVSAGHSPSSLCDTSTLQETAGKVKQEAKLKVEQSHMGRTFSRKQYRASALSVSEGDSPHIFSDDSLFEEFLGNQKWKGKPKDKQSENVKYSSKNHYPSSSLSRSEVDSPRGCCDSFLYNDFLEKLKEEVGDDSDLFAYANSLLGNKGPIFTSKNCDKISPQKLTGTALVEETMSDRERETGEEEKPFVERNNVLGPGYPASARTVRDDVTMPQSTCTALYKETTRKWEREMEEEVKLFLERMDALGNKCRTSTPLACNDTATHRSTGCTLYEETMRERTQETEEGDKRSVEKYYVFGNICPAFVPPICDDASTHRTNGLALNEESTRKRKRERKVEDKFSLERNDVLGKTCAILMPSTSDGVTVHRSTGAALHKEVTTKLLRRIEGKGKLSAEKMNVLRNASPASTSSACGGTFTHTTTSPTWCQETVRELEREMAEENKLSLERNDVSGNTHSVSTLSACNEPSTHTSTGSAWYKETIRERGREMAEKDYLSVKTNGVLRNTCSSSTPSTCDDISTHRSADTACYEETTQKWQREIEEDKRFVETNDFLKDASSAFTPSVRDDTFAHRSTEATLYEETRRKRRREMEEDKPSVERVDALDNVCSASTPPVCDDASTQRSAGATLFEEKKRKREQDMKEEDKLFEDINASRPKTPTSTPSVSDDISIHRSIDKTTYNETMGQREREMEEKDKLRKEIKASDTKSPLFTPSVSDGMSSSSARSSTSSDESKGDRMHNVNDDDEVSEEEECVRGNRRPPLVALQGTWLSRSNLREVTVDLASVYVRGQAHKCMLACDETEWTWNGWALVDAEDGALQWTKKNKKMEWKRVNSTPKLQCTRLKLEDQKKKLAPNAKRALDMLNRKYRVSPAVLKNPNVELYSLEFTPSCKGVFAACLLVYEPRTNVTMIAYIGTRVPMEGFGINEMMLEQVQKLPVRNPGDNKFNRVAALVSRDAPSPKLEWWMEHNFTKDITEELGDENPFTNCSVLECEDCNHRMAERKQNDDAILYSFFPQSGNAAPTLRDDAKVSNISPASDESDPKLRDDAMVCNMFPASENADHAWSDNPMPSNPISKSDDVDPIIEGAPSHAQKEDQRGTSMDVNQTKRARLNESTTQRAGNRTRRDHVVVLEEIRRQREQLQREFQAFRQQDKEQEAEHKSAIAAIMSTVAEIKNGIAAVKNCVNDRNVLKDLDPEHTQNAHHA